MGNPEDKARSRVEAFRRLHPRDAYPGAGLGLSSCRKIVEGLGGRISVSSKLGEGSTFQVTLPRAHEPGAESEKDDRRNGCARKSG